MMYHKALLFNDTSTASEILANPSPQTARTLGRKVTPFSEETWAANRERIVTSASLAKFSRPVSEEGFRRGNGDEAGELPEGKDGRLRAALLGTGEREIVEASPMDRIWGVGFGAKNAGSRRERWGLNLLGKALM
ncbi:NADAR family protein, partial [Candidatus Bathyarchaeota archaeon]|nr:NADAR family protein [Candidatus Bathyarchaeota archaeon]